jgi:NIMA (never in mitosis gene a)-related kinase
MLQHGRSSADQASTLAGTPYYMSPESLAGRGYNAKSDIWALGCIVYELCLLKMAFDGDNLLGMVFIF